MSDIKKLRFWVQRVLPLVYDDSLSYYELLSKVVDKINEMIDLVGNIGGTIEEEVNAIMNEWLESGRLDEIIQESIADFDARITANTQAITVLQAEQKYIDPRRLRGQRIVFFGDSWCVGGSAGAAANRFTTQIATILGMTEENFGVGGAGFTRTNSIISQVTTATGTLTAAVRNAVPLVVLVGGVNDLDNMGDTNFSEFLNACSACVDAIHSAFPNALIVAGLCNTHVSGVTFEQLNWITAAQERIVYHKAYPVLVLKNIYNYVRNRTQWYVEDGLHLSAVGHGVFANDIVNAILGGSEHIFDFIGNITLDSTKVVLASYEQGEAPRVYKNDDMLVMTGFHFTCVENITQNTLIGSIPEACAAEIGHNQYWPIIVANRIQGTMGLWKNFLYMGPNTTGGEISGGFVGDCTWIAH